MLGRYRRLPRINADRSWLGNTPCGLFALTGSVPGKVGSGQKMREWGWGAAAFGQKARRLALKPESASGDKGDFGDRRIGIARREGVDDPLFPEIAPLTIAVEDRVDEVGVEFGEDLGDEDCFVRVVAVAVIRDRNGGGIASNGHGPGAPIREAVSTMDTVPSVWLAT